MYRYDVYMCSKNVCIQELTRVFPSCIGLSLDLQEALRAQIEKLEAETSTGREVLKQTEVREQGVSLMPISGVSTQLRICSHLPHGFDSCCLKPSRVAPLKM